MRRERLNASRAAPDPQSGKGLKHLYRTARWRAIRNYQLAVEPLCRFHLERNEAVEANTVDHVEPHRGDEAKFWSGPFQSLCPSCHSGRKQREENGRRVNVQVGIDGWPVGTEQPQAKGRA